MEQHDVLQHEINKIFNIIENATSIRQKKQKKSLGVSVRKNNEVNKVLEITKNIDGPMTSISRHMLWAALVLAISLLFFEGISYFFRPDLLSDWVWIFFLVILFSNVLKIIKVEHLYSLIQDRIQFDWQFVDQLLPCDERAVQYVLAHCERRRDKFKRDHKILLFLFPSSTLKKMDWIISLLKSSIQLRG